MKCQRDGCDNRLTGRQTKWCSNNCSARQWQKDNPKKTREYIRDYWAAKSQPEKAEWNIRNRYGLTFDDFEALLEDQQGVCAICGEECSVNDRLSVDHSHESGEVRGLLCNRCNTGLGQFRGSPDLLQNAIHYLNKN